MPLNNVEENDDDDAWNYSMSSTESLDVKQELIHRVKKPITTSTATSTTQSQQPQKSQLSLPITFNKTPLDPLTTKEDANSVHTKDSKENSNTNQSQSDPAQNNRFLKDLKEYEIERKDLTSQDEEKEVDKLLASPKIIAYRKSKRTVSEGTFDSIISSPTSQTISSPTTNQNSLPSPPKFDNKLYVDEFYKDSKFRYTVMKRNIEFHQLFQKLDLTDRLLDDFACALSREILLQGRIYISESYICFNSNLLGWVTNLILEFDDIIKFEKKSIAGLFPNGITIETSTGQTHTFASFLSRDSTFELMLTVWKGKTGRTNEDLTKEEEIKIEETALENENREIESYIMSIDGDNEDVESLDEVISPIEKLVKLKPESTYSNKGPDFHLPTSSTVLDQLTDDSEIELVDEVIRAPIGIVFDILFGDNTRFQINFLEQHAGSEISPMGEFHPNEEDPTKLDRKYTYRRNLGYSIGPKSTRCEVREIIEHLNFADYIVVTTITSTPDVPSGGVFQVRTKYILTWGENNHTNLMITHRVEWSGKSWMKNVIEKSSLSGSRSSMKEMIEELKNEIQQNTYFIDSPVVISSTTPIQNQPVAITKKKKTPVQVQSAPSTTTTQVYDLRFSFIYSLLLVIIIFQIFTSYQSYENKKMIQLLIQNSS